MRGGLTTERGGRMARTADVAVIGGGIVGTATAMALTRAGGCRVTVLESEDRLAAHQTGNNSGVIHSGIYYKPGSAKARNCTDGRELLYRFCTENGVPHERCGKLIVATTPDELPALEEIERRGRANGLSRLRPLRAEELHEYEPHVRGVAGLHVPDTGIVDFTAVTIAYARKVREAGGEVHTGARLLAVHRDGSEIVLGTTAGEVRARHLVNCAGLQSDRVARLCGTDPGVQIVPFRGEYYELKPGRAHLVRNLIYPVPDPRLPFLGVHFTRMVHGGVEAGPNAVLAFRREGYRLWQVSGRDLAEMARSRGFWKMARRFWRTGIAEYYRSISRRAFWLALRRLVPEVGFHDLVRAGAGVRAQAVAPDGKLVDDFHIRGADRMIHVLNAPSPAATASISIGRSIAAMAAREFGLSDPHTACA
jgi:L-2-hydroxyglutarate oxidase